VNSFVLVLLSVEDILLQFLLWSGKLEGQYS